jgi:hypothetical protein
MLLRMFAYKALALHMHGLCCPCCYRQFPDGQHTVRNNLCITRGITDNGMATLHDIHRFIYAGVCLQIGLLAIRDPPEQDPHGRRTKLTRRQADEEPLFYYAGAF